MVRRRSTVRFRKGAPERKHEKRHPIRLEADRVAFLLFRLSNGSCRSPTGVLDSGEYPPAGGAAEIAEMGAQQPCQRRRGGHPAPFADFFDAYRDWRYSGSKSSSQATALASRDSK